MNDDLPRPGQTTLPAPRPMSLTENIDWIVPDTEQVLLCVDMNGFEQMSLNQAEILRWVIEAQYQLDYYGSTPQ